MSTYPTLPVTDAFDQQPRDGRQMDVAADGLSRIRKLHPDRVALFVIIHPYLTAAQVITLEAHYAANATGSFDFVSRDGVTYTVAYAARPSYKLHLRGYKSATVRLTQTA